MGSFEPQAPGIAAACPMMSDATLRANLICLVAVAAFEGADMQLLPATFKALETDLHLRLSQLSTLAIGQGVACAAAGPFWGNLADGGVSRRLLICAGMVTWGTLTILLGCISSFPAILVLRVLNGCALGLLVPISQSIIADQTAHSPTARSARGAAFGWIQFGLSYGIVLGSMCFTTMSTATVFGLRGWRVAYWIVGALCIVLAGVVHVVLTEPQRPLKPDRIGFLTELRGFFGYLAIPSFRVIVTQGVFGTVPFCAMSFSTMYFQYAGLSSFHAATAYSMYPIGAGIGGLLGGYVGDALARRSPSYGRPLTAQMSVLMGIPIVLALFRLVPRDQGNGLLYGGLFLLLGLTSSWCGPGCNKPVLLDVVGSEHQASVMSWEKCIESTSGQTIGPVIVSVLSVRFFGYVRTTQTVQEMTAATREANAQALGKALCLNTVVPWAICFGFYCWLQLTYSRDKALQAMESDSLASKRKELGECDPLIPKAA